MSSIDQTAEPARKIAAKQESLTEGKIVRVGFVGLGHMGAGMAANLLKAGHHVTVFNRTPAKTETLVARGAKSGHEHRRGVPRRRGHDHARRR